MTAKATFSLQTRNPDVLTCIANLSNDEVFTPPEFANRMLDTLTAAWAADHGGANLWANPNVRFLDPCTKSGVFLREITRRLNEGLAEHIPGLQQRVDHILTHQVFGIGITQLTALLARRSVYCSKDANGEHSVARSFETEAGNIWFERIEHTWDGNKCRYCGASKGILDRGHELETHAYAFIHTNDIVARVAELFGANMQFDVIIGNPPYQMKGGAGGSSDSSIYHLFVEQAFNLDPRYAIFVIPSRWLAGGRGMEKFRKTMLSSGRIRNLVDYTKMSVAFPGVDFEGGVGYFLWDKSYKGDCDYTLILGDEEQDSIPRMLDEFDVFVRDGRAIKILRKVLDVGEESFKEILSGDTPFGLATNFNEFSRTKKGNALELHLSIGQKRSVAWVEDSKITKNRDLIKTWKVFLAKAYGERGAIPANILSRGIIAGPGSVCTQTYISAGPFKSEFEARSCNSYLHTRFARFLISLRKITQDLLRSTYTWVPQQSWDRIWTDEMLYKKYGITSEEQEFIESMIRPMDSSND